MDKDKALQEISSLVKTSDWNEASFSLRGDTGTVVDLGDPYDFCEVLRRAQGRPSERMGPPKSTLSSCTLSQLCGHKPIRPESIPECCRGRTHFTRVGEWKDRQGLFKFVLAYTQPQDVSGPFQTFKNGRVAYMPVVVTYLDIEAPKSQSRSVTALSGSMRFQGAGALSRAPVSDLITVYEFKNVVFTPNSPVLITPIKPSLLEDLFGDFSRDSLFNFRRCALEFNVKWKQEVSFKPNSFRLIEFLMISEMLEHVCRHLDLRSIKSLKATCQAINGITGLADIARSRLRYALMKVFGEEDPSNDAPPSILKDFEAHLRVAGAIVGGSTPLHILCPGAWKPGDLDIIVDVDHWTTIHIFLTKRAGFLLDEDRSNFNRPFYPGGNGNLDNFKYYHYRNHKEGYPGIDVSVIQADNGSRPSQYIFRYHSTVVMNFWDGYHLYCLWPNLTFNNLLIRNELNKTSKVGDALKKYRERGWKDKYDPEGRLLSSSLTDLIFAPKKVHLQDVYSSCASAKFGIKHIPQPIWREPLSLSSVEDSVNGLPLSI